MAKQRRMARWRASAAWTPCWRRERLGGSLPHAPSCNVRPVVGAGARRSLRSLPSPLSQRYIPGEQLAEVRRVLYGLNQGAPVGALDLGSGVASKAQAAGLDVQGYTFRAAPEQLRPPRVVRVGLVQHSIQRPTTEPYAAQRQARPSTAAVAAAPAAAGAGPGSPLGDDDTYSRWWIGRPHAASIGRLHARRQSTTTCVG